ncbi:MAG: hypothetical protein H2060_12380 [Azoarcus sp.]|nr:hypothetical protein [Azoarcus sp.]
MYLIAIGWMYVVTMASIVNPNPVGGVLTFVFAGLGPLALFLWIFGTPARRRAKALHEATQDPDDSGSAAVDQAPPTSDSQISEANRPVTPSRRKE